MLAKRIAIVAAFVFGLTSTAVFAQKPKSGAAGTQNPTIPAARALVETGKYHEALSALNGILAKEPNNGFAYAVARPSNRRMG